MELGFIRDALAAIGRLEVWLGGARWGVMILGGANFLAADYTGPRSAFDKDDQGGQIPIPLISSIHFVFPMLDPSRVQEYGAFKENGH
jgi:hypothetical protein